MKTVRVCQNSDRILLEKSKYPTYFAFFSFYAQILGKILLKFHVCARSFAGNSEKRIRRNTNNLLEPIYRSKAAQFRSLRGVINGESWPTWIYKFRSFRERRKVRLSGAKLKIEF